MTRWHYLQKWPLSAPNKYRQSTATHALTWRRNRFNDLPPTTLIDRQVVVTDYFQNNMSMCHVVHSDSPFESGFGKNRLFGSHVPNFKKWATTDLRKRQFVFRWIAATFSYAYEYLTSGPLHGLHHRLYTIRKIHKWWWMNVKLNKSHITIKSKVQQEAQLSQRDHAMLRVIEYFAITQGHSRSLEMTSLSRACVSPSLLTIPL